MFNFSVMFDGATRLFHSPNIGELMGDEEPFDLREAIAAAGITPDAMTHLAPDEVVSLLQEKGIDPSELGDEPTPEQIRAFACE
jgi:hypothetical protein